MGYFCQPIKYLSEFSNEKDRWEFQLNLGRGKNAVAVLAIYKSLERGLGRSVGHNSRIMIIPENKLN